MHLLQVPEDSHRLWPIKDVTERGHPSVTVVDADSQLGPNGDTRRSGQKSSLSFINVQLQLPILLQKSTRYIYLNRMATQQPKVIYDNYGMNQDETNVVIVMLFRPCILLMTKMLPGTLELASVYVKQID